MRWKREGRGRLKRPRRQGGRPVVAGPDINHGATLGSIRFPGSVARACGGRGSRTRVWPVAPRGWGGVAVAARRVPFRRAIPQGASGVSWRFPRFHAMVHPAPEAEKTGHPVHVLKKNAVLLVSPHSWRGGPRGLPHFAPTGAPKHRSTLFVGYVDWKLFAFLCCLMAGCRHLRHTPRRSIGL